MFLKASAIESTIFFFFEMNKEYKVSCLELVVQSTDAQKGSKKLIFYIFEYGAEYGAECSGESGAE